jgi:hypothetical protein
MWKKNSNLEKKMFNIKSLHKNDLSEFDDNNNKCDTSILYLGV